MKFWRANRLDQEIERDPEEVAREFIEAVKGGYDLSKCRPILGIEGAYRWWLTDPETFNATWDVKDDGILLDGLDTALTEEERQLIRDKVWEGLG